MVTSATGGDDVVTIPGAQAPARTYRVDAGGFDLAVHEWGDERDPPLFVVHGGFDFARTYDVFAPKLAAAGYRVVGWDQRGHGDSDRTALYSWEADVRDAVKVMEAVTRRPAPVVAHSKGGGLMLHLADAHPHRFTHLANLDGMPFRRPVPDIADHERTRMLTTEVESWLDHRRATATAQRKPGTLDDLARRRGRMNPRLTHEWLRYLVSVGANRAPDGWRWKIDPCMRPGGFGPWRSEWSMMRMPGLAMPFLGIIGHEPEMMGWGTMPAEVAPYLPRGGRVEGLEGVGHFVHIEQPDLVADMVLEFLGAGPA